MAKKVDSKVVTNPFISALLQPTPGRGADRKVWGIPLTGVLVPFFTATDAAGESSIPSESLGCPLRLIREKDGTPKFSATGRPVVRVVKELSGQVRIMRDNFISGLMAYTVRKGIPEQYKAQAELQPFLPRLLAALIGFPLSNQERRRIEPILVRAMAHSYPTLSEEVIADWKGQDRVERERLWKWEQRRLHAAPQLRKRGEFDSIRREQFLANRPVWHIVAIGLNAFTRKRVAEVEIPGLKKTIFVDLAGIKLGVSQNKLRTCGSPGSAIAGLPATSPARRPPRTGRTWPRTSWSP